MKRLIRPMLCVAFAGGCFAAIGCGKETTDGVGGAATMGSVASTGASTSTTTSAGSTNASSSTGGVGPCVLDSSNLDACVLQ
ncbi:MAG: hypothetical protein U0414_31305 [Polyangiaceae bacterium]